LLLLLVLLRHHVGREGHVCHLALRTLGSWRARRTRRTRRTRLPIRARLAIIASRASRARLAIIASRASRARRARRAGGARGARRTLHRSGLRAATSLQLKNHLLQLHDVGLERENLATERVAALEIQSAQIQNRRHHKFLESRHFLLPGV
jgi:hypothetical protein